MVSVKADLEAIATKLRSAVQNLSDIVIELNQTVAKLVDTQQAFGERLDRIERVVGITKTRSYSSHSALRAAPVATPLEDDEQ